MTNHELRTTINDHRSTLSAHGIFSMMSTLRPLRPLREKNDTVNRPNGERKKRGRLIKLTHLLIESMDK